MKKRIVITYGTFDLFHVGHQKILERAKTFGDELIVGVTSCDYDRSRGKLNVVQTVHERVQAVIDTGLASKVIVEEFEGQKQNDIQKYGVDCFVIGDDWKDKFDYLKPYCDVVYLERTRGVSSSQVRGERFSLIRLGIVGTGRIARRFVPEARFVSGVDVAGVYSRVFSRGEQFQQDFELEFSSSIFSDFLAKVDAVYIASEHEFHYEQAKKALLSGKHVLLEKPATLCHQEFLELSLLAKERRLVLLEAIKTAYAPAFNKLLEVVRGGGIGRIVEVSSAFTKLSCGNVRELSSRYGGSLREFGSYCLLPVVKLLGSSAKVIPFRIEEKGVDVYSKVTMHFEDKAVATITSGLSVKREGDLVIAGTEGYV